MGDLRDETTRTGDEEARGRDEVPTVPAVPTSPEAPTLIRQSSAPPCPPAAADPAADAIGRIVAATLDPSGGRVVSRGELTRGGMGVLERVFDRVLLREIVVKTILEEESRFESVVRDFVREAQITGQLDHPNVVPVHGLGTTADGRLSITMKLVEGRTLHAIIRDLPDVPIDRGQLLDLIEVVLKVCDALARAHSRGVLHCDVKPANVMVGEFGQVYLMDWGIAQLAPQGCLSGAKPVTCSVDSLRDDFVRGTPAWMAPEQAMNAGVDARTDVFAVGALLYAVLCRRPPFKAHDADTSVYLARLCDFPPPRELVPDAPAGLERIVLRAMAEDPAHRYQSIQELRSDLVGFVRGGGDFPRVEVLAGTVVVREGEPGDSAYIIERGRCEVIKLVDGQPTRLREMGEGEVFGETAILASSPRTATVVALEDTVLRQVTARVLEEEVGSMKPWMAAFIRTLARRFQERESGS